MSTQIPIVGKIVRHTHWICKRKQIAPILDSLSQAGLLRGVIAKVRHDTSIPYNTLRDWHDMRNRPGQANRFPLCDGHPAARVSDDDTEASIIDCFKTSYIEHGIGGAKQALNSLCLNCCSSTPPEKFKRDRFCASSQFLHGLEKTHCLMMRRLHAEKQTEIDEASVRYFCDGMRT
jgi:hypothetical protein